MKKMKETAKRVFEEPEVRVVLYGVGVMGSSIARLLLRKRGVKIVGAIGGLRTPDKVGKDLSEIIGAEKPLGVAIRDDPKALLSEVKADIAVHTTTSYIKDVYPQLVELIKHKVNVVSTCEELSYPYISEPNLSEKLDKLAKEYGVTVLGTGVNPGFLMDTLPITLTGVCQQVESIKVERVMNAATRRIPFQRKIGAGLSVKEFEEKIRTKAITGHVGLEQSTAMIASALGWVLQKIEVGPVEPVIAEKPVKSDAIKVEVGKVAGLRQSCRGVKEEKPAITLDFRAYIGAEQEYDSITIEGVPRIYEKITPCVHGDLATVAVTVNSIPKVINAEPGLKTMKDLPIPSAAIEDMRLYIE